MKKLFYIGALSALLLTACGEEEAKPKEETPAAEPSEVKEEPVTAEPTQEELNKKMRSEAIELDFVAANTDEVTANTKVFVKGKVSTLMNEGVGGEFIVTTTEGDGFGMFNVENYTLADLKEGSDVIVYGSYKGKNDLGMPTITATIIE